MNKFNTPVLFLIFNRPETTIRVFQKIREAQPAKLYIAADGPRDNRAGERERCKEVRSIVTDIDWECEVRTLFREENLGCRIAVSSAIDWFFDNEEMGIILEDDCLPSSTFFGFCNDLLERYKNDQRVFIISGYNKQEIWKPENHDYFFSHLGGIWGWASWRRAWAHFDLEMSKLDEFMEGKYFEYLFGSKVGKLRRNDVLYAPKSTWDYSWGFSRHLNSGLACVPSKNLISNIGFGRGATHTSGQSERMRSYEITLPLKENEIVVADKNYDELFLKPKSIIQRFKNKLTKLFLD
jgi:hypothetical protein